MHVLGAGPVGLVMTALLQSTERFSVRLYEKRRDYTRTRMVQLAPYLVADSIESYCADHIDGESVEAIFDPSELAEGLAFRQSIPPDLMGLLRDGPGVLPAQRDRALPQRSHRCAPANPGAAHDGRGHGGGRDGDARAGRRPDRLHRQPGRCSGIRWRPAPATADGEANTFKLRLEYALVVTFLYGQAYDCNEYCKYYKNIDNAHYKFIPAVHRTYSDGSITHVTGIVNITAEDYERMPSRFDGQWLRDNFPEVAQSMDRFIAKIKTETHGEIVGDLEIVRIPLDLYRARNATSRQWRDGAVDHPSPLAGVPRRRFGHGLALLPVDLARLRVRHVPGGAAGAARPAARRTCWIATSGTSYKQWLRVYMRTKMIKHNKDLFECVGDTFALLEKLHIY